MKALIDGDMVMFQMSHAVTNRYYQIDGYKKHYKSIVEARKFCDKKGLDHSAIKQYADPKDDLGTVLDTVDGFVAQIVREADASTYELYFTGRDNFRKEVAVTHEYKGNRKDGGVRPCYLSEIREWLLDNHPSVECNNCEADDGLGINQSAETIICSKDKDLLMIPGNHYNWGTKVHQIVDPDEGMMFFWKQVLMGDKTDNIHGINGVGPKTADRIIIECEDPLCTVGLHYAIHFDDPESRLIENMNLLWIRQEEGQEWILDTGKIELVSPT